MYKILKARWKHIKLVMLLLFPVVLSAQQENTDTLFYFKGKVVDADEMNGLYNVHVINKTLHTGTVSALDGLFRVPAREGDTLLLSLVGYRKTSVVVREAHRHQNNPLLIPMRFDLVDMEAITIYGKTFEQFRQDFKTLRINPKTINKMTLKSIDEEMGILGPASATGFSGPIQFLYDRLNQTESLRRRLQNNRKKTSFPPEAYEGFPTHPSEIKDTTRFE